LRRLLGAAMVAAGLGAAAAGARGRGHPARRESQPPGRIVRAAGVAMHYIERGRGDPIVLIHGLGGTTGSWAGVIPLLAANHRVIAMDLAGFGFSGKDAGLLLTQSRQSERVAAVMEALGISRATVVGHSLGGAVAQRLAADFPGKVERLVLVASVDAAQPEGWAPDGLKARVLGRLSQPRTLLTPACARGAARSLLRRAPPVPNAKVRRDASLERPLDAGRISAPTLVISGSADAMISPEAGEAIRGRIRDARHTVLGGAGHLIPEERSEELVEEILAFMHEAGPASD
jgi:pimeloyl-ACP methyl ester carboxylesterase